MMKKLYFESVDSNDCYPLEYFLNQARLEKESEITLIEAFLLNTKSIAGATFGVQLSNAQSVEKFAVVAMKNH